MVYVKIRSYHVVRTWTRVPGGYITLCGRRGNTPHSYTTFGEERSCETCLRIAAKGVSVQ